jgi:hypothetical protein
MAKAIFQGRNGLTNSIKNEDDKYSVGYLIDPFRDWGFLKPAAAGTTITETSNSYFKDMAYSNALLALTNNYKIYSVDTVNNTATKVHDTPGASATSKMCAYQTKVGGTLNVNTIFYFYGTTAGLYDGTNFTDNWIATTPAGASSLGTAAVPYVWQNFMMVGYTTASSNYIAKFDGSNGNDGTLTPTWFDIGSNWAVKSFFNYYNYLGVVIYNGYSYEYQILLLDGSSTTLPVKRISVPDAVINSFNVNNDLVIYVNGALKQLGDNGLDTIQELSFENKNTIGSLYTFNTNTSYSDKLNNNIYTSGSNGVEDIVLSVGKKDLNSPYITSQLYNPTGSGILMIKGIYNLLFVSSYTGSNYYLQYFSTGNGAATLKYPFKDFGQTVIAKYVKFYFKPLVSGDSITVGLDTDYGTSTSLGTISFATHGAITSKRFEIKKQCHAFRPTVSWTTGGTAISKVTVEYEFVSDT